MDPAFPAVDPFLLSILPRGSGRRHRDLHATSSSLTRPSPTSSLRQRRRRSKPSIPADRGDDPDLLLDNHRVPHSRRSQPLFLTPDRARHGGQRIRTTVNRSLARSRAGRESLLRPSASAPSVVSRDAMDAALQGSLLRPSRPPIDLASARWQANSVFPWPLCRMM